MMPLGADGKPSGPPKPFLQSEFNAGQEQLSPDGRWLAYVWNESGVYEIYVRSFPDGNNEVLVSNGGGVEPPKRADGKELFYRRITGELVAVEVTVGPKFQVGASKALFMARFAGAGTANRNPAWTARADGKRFLGMVRSRQTGDDIPVTVVVNWQSELKK